ncbi:MAG: hypothetical protein H7333_11410 [Bdellovibrionales bacterium]|nr:hypothetical protein [Oligoflexia bacterium]
MSNVDRISKSVLVGFVPLTFPRDPIFVNLFDEHTVLGKIFEPLLEADKNGVLIPGIASDWITSENGKTITFSLMKDRHFSNGSLVTIDDVVYSIKRHLESSKSQSRDFLKDVLDVSETPFKKVAIQLSKPNPAVLKALTRDHLGILPNGWIFDAASDEPLIGCGPYPVVRDMK